MAGVAVLAFAAGVVPKFCSKATHHFRLPLGRALS
jgi:hypothetical protein